MGTIEDRNSKDLEEAEEIKKRSKEYREELYKKGLNGLDNHDGLVTQLEPDILECEVKRALASITMDKDSGGDRFLAEIFKILKNGAIKGLHSLCEPFGNSAVVTGLEKTSLHSNPREGNAREYSNCLTMCSFHILAKGFSKSFKLDFNSK